MSDFFGTTSTKESTVEAVERAMRREERLYHQRRQIIMAVLAVAVTGVVLLGWGLVATGASRSPVSPAGVSVAASDAPKKAKSRSKSRRSRKKPASVDSSN